MLQHSLTTKREAAQHKIKVYETRRDKFRLKYNVSMNTFPKQKAPREYHKAVKNINDKIKMWYAMIRAYDIRMNRIRALGNAVTLFTGYNVKDSGKLTSKKGEDSNMKLARSIFYKYGLENSSHNKDLREYVGAKRPSQPADYRREFNRSFRDIKSNNKELYNRFKKSYETTLVSANDFIDNRKATN